MANENSICIDAIVSGKVQGVFYRDSTRKKAQELQVTGWVKILLSGEVEVFACGERENVMNLVAWLRQGPERAHVVDVQWKEVSWELHNQFQIK